MESSRLSTMMTVCVMTKDCYQGMTVLSVWIQYRILVLYEVIVLRPGHCLMRTDYGKLCLPFGPNFSAQRLQTSFYVYSKILVAHMNFSQYISNYHWAYVPH